MRLNEVTYTDANPVLGYGPGFFRIGKDVHFGPLLTSATGVAPWTGFEDAGPLVALAGQVDVLFIGTGAEIAYLPPALRTQLEAAEIAFEIMASPTAARTYNVLLAEGRRIALAMIPV
ncbi:MAG: hypothetical protein ACI9IV_000534 [Paracoccaceae bacterium]|jgi:uncharacterized protein